MSEKISPITKLPLRSPGQYIDEKREEIFDEIAPLFALAFSVMSMALIEWIQFFGEYILSPWYLTVLAILVIVFVFVSIRRKMRKLNNYNVGGVGEKYVAGYFHSHIYEGYIFCDIQTGYDNIDLVVVSPKGVFSIEIKTLRKQLKVKNTISSPAITKNAVAQAKRESQWLKNLTNTAIPITPVVLYPEWWVDESITSKHKHDGVLVLNEKYFMSIYDSLPNIFNKDEIDSIRNVLLNHHNKQ